MTRIDGDPGALITLARLLADEAADLETMALRLSAAVLPEMPPDAAAPLEELVALLELRANPSAIIVVDRMGADKREFSVYLYGIGAAG
jgi:hypothetical protein